MNLFFYLPYDIQSHIYSFVKSSYANYIIHSWKRYLFYKNFIIDSIYSLPKFNSFIDFDDLVFSVVDHYTYFLFKKLYKLTTGNESYFLSIFILFYRLAISIDEYEWISGHDNLYYNYNKFFCISTAIKFKWNYILQILQ
jgi:hypothetical protein